MNQQASNKQENGKNEFIYYLDIILSVQHKNKWCCSEENFKKKKNFQQKKKQDHMQSLTSNSVLHTVSKSRYRWAFRSSINFIYKVFFTFFFCPWMCFSLMPCEQFVHKLNLSLHTRQAREESKIRRYLVLDQLVCTGRVKPVFGDFQR